MYVSGDTAGRLIHSTYSTSDQRNFIENTNSQLTDYIYLGLFLWQILKGTCSTHIWKSGAATMSGEIIMFCHDRPVLSRRLKTSYSRWVFIITTRTRINGKWVKTVSGEKLNSKAKAMA